MNKDTCYDNICVIILAAGLGTRMKSNKAKVLHEVLGKPMISYVVDTSVQVSGNNVILVIGHQAEQVRDIVSQKYEVSFALQEKQLGTGHAVACAVPYIPKHIEHVIILCGDVPLITSNTLKKLIHDHTMSGRDLTILAVDLPNPTGYGRIIYDKYLQVSGIIEEADASEVQKQIKLINSGIYCIKTAFISDIIQQLTVNNIQKEYYLTEMVEIGYKHGKKIGMYLGADSNEIIGVNRINDLKNAEAILLEKMKNKKS